MPLLNIKNLGVEFPDRYETDYAVEDVCFDLEPGEILGPAGENYCGKSANARMTAGLQSCAMDASLSAWAGQLFSIVHRTNTESSRIH
jgi:ABC-type glutathione transport system ATPase component